MPSVVHKAALRKAIEEEGNVPKEILGLVCRGQESQEGGWDLLSGWWGQLGQTIGAMELAYRRGYDVGFDAGQKAAEAEECEQ